MTGQLVADERIEGRRIGADARPGAAGPVRPRARRRLLRAVVGLGGLLTLGLIYTWIRSRGGTDASLAREHALDVIRLEGRVFTHLEVPLDHWLTGVPVLAVAACYFYALMHYLVTPFVLLWSRHVGGRQYWRGYWALVIGSGIALIGYATWPAAPPRLTSGEGIVDVMRHFAQYGWWGSAASAPRGLGDATNQFAAMPSLHFGWSLWCAIQMWGFGRRWRVVAIAYPTVQALVVLGTGNHFLLDVIAGGTVIVLGYAIAAAAQRAWDAIALTVHRPR